MDKYRGYPVDGTKRDYDNIPCGHCGLMNTPEGHDGCIGTLDNVMNACCGHGDTREAWVQFDHDNYNKEPNMFRISGEEAIEFINKNKK